MNLEEIRKKIDVLDENITNLLVERMEITKQVAEFKKENNLPVFQPEREQKVLEKVSALAGDEYGIYISEIYKSMMNQSKKNQEKYLNEKYL